MKRLLTLLLMLVSLASATWAGLTVGDVTVTATGNVSPSGLKSGTIYYDASTNTLTLNNATLAYEPSANSNDGVITTSKGTTLTITVKGTNSVTSSKAYAGLWFNNSTITFNGDGSLDVAGRSDDLYGLNESTIIIKGSVRLTAMNKGIGTNNYCKKLTVAENAVVKAKHISYVRELELLNGQEIVEPAGATFENNAVRVNGSLAQNVVIQKVETYPIYVCGKQVNSKNCADILGDGKVTYNNSTKTLTLNNATIDNSGASGEPAYCLKFDDFQGTVQLVGDNKVVSIRHCAIQTVNDKSEVTFKGSGSLTAKGPNYGLMPWAGKIILSDNVKVTAEGVTYGIGSNNSGKFNETVVVSGNAQVKASTIGAIHALILEDGQQIVAPAGAVFKLFSEDTNHGVCESESSNTLAKNVVIMKAETYPIEVCDMAVNSYNAADILGDGTFKYDNSTKTLTINGATIDDTSLTNVVLNKNVEDLKINIVGTNNLKVNSQLFELKAKTTFTGTGTVNGEVTDWQSIGIFLNKNANYQVIADGPTFNIKGARGVTGFAAPTFVMNSGKFVFEPSGTNENIFNAIGNSAFTLGDGMAIVEPEGGYYDSSLRSITVDGTERYRGKVVIQKVESYGLEVSGIPVTSLNCADILGDGKVIYDNSTKTLTLNGATIINAESSESSVIQNAGVNPLTISVQGEASVVAEQDGKAAIISSHPVTIQGSGKLTLKSKSDCGLYVPHTSATIKDIELEASGAWGIAGYGGSEETLTIENAIVRAEGPNGAICDFKTITLGEGLSILTPADGKVSGGAVVDASGAVAKEVVIGVDTSTKYDLFVNGAQVTSVNAADILGNGVFKYDDATKTLTIKGNYDNTAESRLVDSSIDGLIVNVEGASKLSTTRDVTLLRFTANTEIRGGKLILECTSEDQDCIGIYQDGGDKLTISNADIEIGDGFSYAITGEPGIALEVISSDIVAKAHAEGCFKDFESMTLTDCYIESHRGATYTDGALVDTDGHIIGSDAQPETVVIKRGTDAVNGIAAGTAATDVFDVAGRKLDAVGRGINIVRSADGRVRKVLKK